MTATTVVALVCMHTCVAADFFVKGPLDEGLRLRWDTLASSNNGNATNMTQGGTSFLIQLLLVSAQAPHHLLPCF